MQPAKRKRSTKSKTLDIPVEASFFSRLAGAARHKRHDVQEKLFDPKAIQPTLARHGSDLSVSCPTVEKWLRRRTAGARFAPRITALSRMLLRSRRTSNLTT
jgi:hypothetical protein